VSYGKGNGVIKGRTREFEPAKHELSDDEIRSSFSETIKRAEADFTDDPGYAVEMAEHAALVKYKRDLWAARTDVTKAEKLAHIECRKHLKRDPAFVCHATAACGFGGCRFASAEAQLVNAEPPEARSRLKTRPAPAANPLYRIEDTIETLLQIRGVQKPPKLSGGRHAA